MTSRLRCTLCGSTELMRLFDLGVLPLGFPTRLPPGDVWRAPLAIACCARCACVQTEVQLPADLLLAETFYTSGRSESVAQHDARFAGALIARGLAAPESLVLEIGCGDGSLLNTLLDRRACRAVGVEPSPHPDCDYRFDLFVGPFDASMERRLRSACVQPDVIVVNHVLDGVPDPAAFMGALSAVLKPGGTAVIEVPYVLDLIDGFRLDGFVHSRNLWLTLGAFRYACAANAMRLADVEHEPGYRGGTLRVFATKDASGIDGSTATQILAREAAALSPARFQSFRAAIAEAHVSIRQQLPEYLGPAAYVYGGGLKAATVVNWLGLTAGDVVCAVDNDPHKQGKYIPGTAIPIEPLSTLWERKTPVNVLHCALDHRTEVDRELQRCLADGSAVLYPLPSWQVRRVVRRHVHTT